jgi:methylamine dehydrogenase accessory protein MauD
LTGLWLVSYVVLWVLVVILGLLLIGVLRQLGLLQGQRELPAAAPAAAIPTVENDGPSIGTRIPDLVAPTVNGFGAVALATPENEGSTLLMFMSPMCETCQHVVEPLNALAEDAVRAVRPVVIMRADEQACRAFLSVFPLRLPTICDSDRTITMGFDVHGTPLGLLYDEHGTLTRKGLVMDHDDLLALLGHASAPAAAQAHVFPQFAPPKVVA